MANNVIQHLTSKDALPWLLYYVVDHTPLRRWLSDKAYLKIQYRCLCGKPLNLKNPQTFNEKLQWLKIYNHNPECSKMVDKYEAKKYVASIIGEEYIIPTLGVWSSVEEIVWETLPKQFVLKCTHDSGGLVVCKDKSQLNKGKVLAKIKNSLTKEFYYSTREWPYKNVVPRIIAEKFMSEDRHSDTNEDLADYKFFCFNGKPTYCQVIQGRWTTETIDFFDMDWNHMPFVGLNSKVVNASVRPQKPDNYSEMVMIAAKLSKDIPFSRIDLYDINGRIFFGEITFYPHGGMGIIKPEEWNYKFGELITLPNLNNNKQ